MTLDNPARRDQTQVGGVAPCQPSAQKLTQLIVMAFQTDDTEDHACRSMRASAACHTTLGKRAGLLLLADKPFNQSSSLKFS